MRRGGAVYYYARDGRGNITGLIASNGTVAATYTYEPYGKTEASETVPNPYRFGAREQDTETGLYYNRARYYDPRLERFLSEDPLGLAGGINPYAYAGNDPINYRDPTGLERWCVYWYNYDYDSMGEIYLVSIEKGECWDDEQDEPEAPRGKYAQVFSDLAKYAPEINSVVAVFPVVTTGAAVAGTVAAEAAAVTAGRELVRTALHRAIQPVARNAVTRAEAAAIRAETTNIGAFLKGAAEGWIAARTPNAAPLEPAATFPGKAGQVAGWVAGQTIPWP
jgi:RHS repeat-associated protein